ncbi:MAG: SGNH/GDSL hydrolase family protein [Thermodesulfobacteriota bacterium]
MIACLGDSNTDSNWQYVRPGGFPPGGGWCEQLGSLLGGRATMVNLGAPGATAVWTKLPPVAEQGIFFNGYDQLEHALAASCADVVLIAFGTNDVLPGYGYDAAGIVAAHLDLVRSAHDAGMLAFVATAPRPLPVPKRKFYSRSVEAVARFNELLRRALPPETILDFEARLVPEDSFDDLHMNLEGQRKRALEAKARIDGALARGPLLPPPPGPRLDDGCCRACRVTSPLPPPLPMRPPTPAASAPEPPGAGAGSAPRSSGRSG